MVLTSIFVFIFGAIIGSFLNVVILRFGTGLPIFKIHLTPKSPLLNKERGQGERSFCFSCRADLKWFELIPIFSFFLQRGHCRKCYSRISIQYPVVEFLTGLVFLSVYYLLSTNYLLIFYYWLVFSLLIVISVYDFRHKIIPNKLVYFFIILALASSLLSTNYSLLTNLLAGAVLFLPFFLLWFFSKGRLIGLGDAKLALGVGFLLGLSQGISALLLSFWIGAIFGIILMVLKKRVSLKTEIPFGPFLALATFIIFILNIDFNAIIQLLTF